MSVHSPNVKTSLYTTFLVMLLMQISIAIHYSDKKILKDILPVFSLVFLIDGFVGYSFQRGYKKVLGKIWVFYTVCNSFYLLTKFAVFLYLCFNCKYDFSSYRYALVISYIGYIFSFVKDRYCEYERNCRTVFVKLLIRLSSWSPIGRALRPQKRTDSFRILLVITFSSTIRASQARSESRWISTAEPVIWQDIWWAWESGQQSFHRGYCAACVPCCEFPRLGWSSFRPLGGTGSGNCSDHS